MLCRQFLERVCCENAASHVPQGRTDRSLARSAWESVPKKKPSRRVRYDRAHLIPEVFFVQMCAVFLEEGQSLFLKGSCPMMFELLLETNRIQDRKANNINFTRSDYPRTP